MSKVSSEAGKILPDWGKGDGKEMKRAQTWGSRGGLSEVQPWKCLCPRVALKQKPTSSRCIDVESYTEGASGVDR